LSEDGCFNERRSAGMLYGFCTLKRFFRTANKILGESFALKHIVHGHDHDACPFDQRKCKSITTTVVISAAEFVDAYRRNSSIGLSKRNRNHASVVLLRKGKVPKEYFGIVFNDNAAEGIVLDENAFFKSDIEILDIMFPISLAKVADRVFARSKIKKIIVHDYYSFALLTGNKARYGIGPQVEIVRA